MPLYLISYDLHKKREYDALIAQLEKWHARRIAYSVWLGNLRGPASIVRDLLRTLVDTDDDMVVIELKPGSEWATYTDRDNPGIPWLHHYLG